MKYFCQNLFSAYSSSWAFQSQVDLHIVSYFRKGAISLYFWNKATFCASPNQHFLPSDIKSDASAAKHANCLRIHLLRSRHHSMDCADHNPLPFLGLSLGDCHIPCKVALLNIQRELLSWPIRICNDRIQIIGLCNST